MSTANWLKAHRKRIIIHTSIVAVFALFLIFLSEPLFDRLESVQGESGLHDFPLPAETGAIAYYFDDFATDGRTVVEIRGWAFISGEDCENIETYIVLKSTKRTYIFDIMQQTRTDVTQAFDELDLNLDYSGFRALIPIRKIANGEYAVGIYIRKGDREALTYTNKTVIKSGGAVETR
jgi:hypothetical protein